MADDVIYVTDDDNFASALEGNIQDSISQIGMVKNLWIWPIVLS